MEDNWEQSSRVDMDKRERGKQRAHMGHNPRTPRSLGFKFSKRKKLFYYNIVNPSLSSPQPPTDGLLINVNRAEHSIQQVSCFVLILSAFLFKQMKIVKREERTEYPGGY